MQNLLKLKILTNIFILNLIYYTNSRSLSKTGNNDFYPNAMIQTKYTPYPFDGHGSWCSANTSGQLILSIT